jgi:hypothetical protein
VDQLEPWLPQMMEGMLIWADDSKNKFRLKVWQDTLQVLEMLETIGTCM